MLSEYAPYLFNIGMFDENERDYFQKETQIALQLIKQGKYLEAYHVNKK